MSILTYYMVAIQPTPAARGDLHISWKAWRVLWGPGDKQTSGSESHPSRYATYIKRTPHSLLFWQTDRAHPLHADIVS